VPGSITAISAPDAIFAPVCATERMRRFVGFQLGDESSLMDCGTGTVGIDDGSSGGSGDLRGLEQGDDLRAAGRVSEANQRESGVAADHGRLVLQHLQE
jgi:hypothetical protein